MQTYRTHLVAVLNAIAITETGTFVIPSQQDILLAIGRAQIYLDDDLSHLSEPHIMPVPDSAR